MKTFSRKFVAWDATSAKPKRPLLTGLRRCREVNSTHHFAPPPENREHWLLWRHDQDVASTRTPLSPGLVHDFSKIPLYGPAQASMRAKQKVRASGDESERQADHVADEAMSRPSSGAQVICPSDGRGPRIPRGQQDEDHGRILPKPALASLASDEAMPSNVNTALHSNGQSLDARTRDLMGMRFGHDFRHVRVHFDGQAAKSAEEISARAYTVGDDIVFGAGQYSPGTTGGQRLLAHELAHVIQQRAGAVPRGTVQRAPSDRIEVTLVEVSRSKSDLLFHDLGVKLPGSPPRVQFGEDGAIPRAAQKAVQLAFDLAYATAASPLFSAKLDEFKKRMAQPGKATLPGLAGLTQQKYLAALKRMTIHLADTSKNPLVKDYLRKESRSGEKLPIAGFTPIGGSNVYIRAFALTEGRDALASLILHESAHVAGLPTKPINAFLETILELSIHGFEASVGLPLSQIVQKSAVIREVKPHGQGVEFKVDVKKTADLPSDTVRVEILDGNRRQVFSHAQPKAKFSKRFIWNGLDSSGKPTESGIHSIRVVAGAVLIAAYDYVLRRAKK